MLDQIERVVDWYLDWLERVMPEAGYDTVTIVAIVGWWLVVLSVALGLVELVAWWV